MAQYTGHVEISKRPVAAERSVETQGEDFRRRTWPPGVSLHHLVRQITEADCHTPKMRSRRWKATMRRTRNMESATKISNQKEIEVTIIHADATRLQKHSNPWTVVPHQKIRLVNKPELDCE